MRHPVAALAALVVLSACMGSPSAPATVQPTLAGIATLGLRCGDGVPDNVPSGLIEWRCQGELDDAASSLLVDGNDEGVAGITLVMDESTDPRIARRGFGRLIEAVPPVNAAPGLVDGLAGWTGEQLATVVDGVRISAVCTVTQCIVTLASAADPLRPLPLP